MTTSVSTLSIEKTLIGKGIGLLIGLVSLLGFQAYAQPMSSSIAPKIFEMEVMAKVSPLLQKYIGSIPDDHLFQIEFLTNDTYAARELCSSLRLKADFILFSAFNFQYATCEVNKKQLMQLTLSNFIQHLELVRTPSMELKQEGLDPTLNEIKLLQHDQPELAGNDMILSIKEYDPDSTDVDFRGRYFSTELSSEIVHLHATSMASIVGGGGNSDPTAKGVAWDAFITSSNFEILLPDPETYFNEYGITVQNHSYGTGIENYYGIETLAYDELCYHNPSLIHVFSSGNDGEQSPPDGKYAGLPGWANLTGQFKQSKNTIAVGATDSLGNVVPFSSKGPAYDGRIKPEVVAYGHGGTSGAAAIVSGLSVLIQQAFIINHAGMLPSSSLVKAILINTALDVGRTGPDYVSGFGSVRGYEAIQSVEAIQFIENEISQGDTMIFPLHIPEEKAQVKITLAWTDPEVNINASMALMNDLDLTLQNMSTGEIFRPWVLSTFPNPDSLSLPAKRGVDTVNNIEQLTISFPEPGEYVIQVDGHKIQNGSQAFAFCWYIEPIDNFQWAYPTKSDYLLSGKKNIIRWKASDVDSGRIEYKNVSSDHWILVKEMATSSDQFTWWVTPEEADLFQLRWIVSDTTVVSDTFVITTPLQPKLGFLCADSLLLHWTPVQADSFEMFRIDERHLAHYLFTSDTLYIEHNIELENRHYAIAGYYGGIRGPLSYGLDITSQAAGCYINSFFLRFIDNGIANLEANLGSLYNVDSVVLYQLEFDIYIPIDTIYPVIDTKLFLESQLLREGVTYFRLEVSLNDGTMINSDDLPVYYVESKNLFLYPNPVYPQEELNVIVVSNDEFQLMIIDDLGRKIIEIDDAENPQKIPISGLVPGHYMVVIRNESGWLGAEGFVVRE